MQKATLLSAAFALLIFTPAAYANGEAPPEQPAAQQCGEQPCTKTVTHKKVIGHRYKTVRVPIYKTVTKTVPCGGDCAPKVVQSEGVDIPAPKPKVVIQEQQIIVKTVPKIVYAPVPPVQLGPQRPIVYERPQMVRVAPPPPPQVMHAAPCPQPCPRPQAVCGPRPCPPAGYGPAGYGPAGHHGSQRVAAHPTAPAGQPGGGYIAGAPRNAEECFARGGTLANGGRGCQDYR